MRFPKLRYVFVPAYADLESATSEQMEINPNADAEALPEDHPTVQVLSGDERALYASLVMTLQTSVDEVVESQNDNGEIDTNPPELRSAVEDIRTASTLARLIEEAADKRTTALDNEPSSLNHQSSEVGSDIEDHQ